MNRVLQALTLITVATGCALQPVLAQTAGANSPFFGTVKGNPTVNYQSSENYHFQPKIQQATNVSVIVRSPDTSKLNALQRHQDALLLAENPTKVELAGVEIRQWLGDDEEFISPVFHNSSKLPATRFKFGIPDPRGYGNVFKGMKYLQVPTSASPHTNEFENYQIEAGQNYFIPLISIIELRKLLGLRPEQCIALAYIPEASGKTPDLPHKAGVTNSAVYSLPVGFTYRTIFDQDVMIRTLVSILVTERAMLIPQTGDSDIAIRCHDPRNFNASDR